jgi:hypothetical protein
VVCRVILPHYYVISTCFNTYSSTHTHTHAQAWKERTRLGKSAAAVSVEAKLAHFRQNDYERDLLHMRVAQRKVKTDHKKKVCVCVCVCYSLLSFIICYGVLNHHILHTYTLMLQ